MSTSLHRRACLLGLLAVSTARAQDKERTRLLLNILASDGVNPDDAGRAAPIRLRIYELRDVQAFQEADYFSLDEKDRTLLGADLLARDEFILRPGESRRIERSSHPQTRAIGVLAGYRSLAQSTWRVVQRLPDAPDAAWYRALVPANKSDLRIELQAQGIAVSNNAS
ncbi:type VI secretion system lipoprotein TssJ [Pelomonas sp. KK5]|uniref:type VI secretion system lipoprotein TssJ n=1 Tax=Pelomonas sp. KK5 TaxID=1855730 RepID=UPI00097C4B9F|nr:type VI secretion system lipoprotein TssJ [Pelomonas sp. KK5]